MFLTFSSKLDHTIHNGGKTMLEYNPVPTNNRQFDQGIQLTKKRNRNKKHKTIFSEIKTLKEED
jgi:hypothetical protein